MKKNNIDLQDFPEKVEVWQALQNGKLAFEHPCRALVNGYMIRNNITGRPKSEMAPFASIYRPGQLKGELELIKS